MTDYGVDPLRGMPIAGRSLIGSAYAVETGCRHPWVYLGAWTYARPYQSAVILRGRCYWEHYDKVLAAKGLVFGRDY